ncbi:MAG: PocR ligand-binding domain-containing protein [Spirochaetaceae bacterium]
MDNRLHELDYIINIEKFQKIQDDIAKATDMAVIAIDYKGHPITKHSGCSDFCKKVRKNIKLNMLCEKCDSRGGLEAARDQKPYIYLCHLGVVDFAIPIIVDGHYLGALMAGQVRLQKEENNNKLEDICSSKDKIDLDSIPELREMYEQLYTLSLEKIEAIAQMMNHLINYIVGEAVLKTSLYEINQKLTEPKKNEETHLYYPIGETEQDNSVYEAHRYSLLKPAISFIHEKYKEKIYLNDMAYKCNISPSYFSKIFKRELGENFSNYVNKVKVDYAKKILETTNLPIIDISLDFGFDDCGYFIKVFKKFTGETPASYRTHFHK